jgi:hypothetical protein
VQLVFGLLLDVRRPPELRHLLLVAGNLLRCRLPLGQQLVDLLPLREVLAHRVGEAERDRADHHGQQRRPAGKTG